MTNLPGTCAPRIVAQLVVQREALTQHHFRRAAGGAAAEQIKVAADVLLAFAAEIDRASDVYEKSPARGR